jgi:YVTN family beta-propeller protein
VAFPRALRSVVGVVLLGAALGMPSPALAQPLAYVLGDRTGTNDLVTVVDTATLAKVTSIPVGSGSPALYGGGIAVAPDGGRVYVVNNTDQTISVISTLTNTVLGTFASGQNATSIIVSPDGSRLYVGNGSGSGNQTLIRVISTASGATIGTIGIGTAPTFATLGIAVSADGRRLYATGWTGMCSGNTVKVIDTAAGAVVASIPMPSFPGALALTPDGATLYGTNMGSTMCTGVGTGVVSVIDTASSINLGSIGVGVNPMSVAVSPDGQRVFVPNNGVPFSVSIISRSSNSVIGSIPGSIHMRGIAFTPDGRRALSPWDDGLAVFDAISNTPLATIPINPATEGQPRAVVVLPMPPEPPTDLFAASIVGNRVTLQWRPPTVGVVPTSYAVEGGTAPGQVAATLPTGSSLPIYTFIAPSGVFYVRVRALSGGVPGQPSNEIRVAVNPALPPSAPEGLVGLVNGSSVALAWRNTNAGGWPTSTVLDVTGSLTTQLVLPPGESFTFNDVPPGSYTLAVRSANTYGSSAPSNSVTLTFPGACSGAPLAPVNVRVYKAGFRLFVYWDPATGGPAPTFYVLRVTGSFTGAFQTADRTLSGTVGPGIYSISLAAANVCGQGPSSGAQTVAVP